MVTSVGVCEDQSSPKPCEISHVVPSLRGDLERHFCQDELDPEPPGAA